jgi:hypothetical protein
VIFNKNTISKDDSLFCIPKKQKAVKETFLDSGDLLLSYHTAYKPFFNRIQKILHKNSKKTFERKIQLDGLGIDVWQLMTGTKNVKQIISEFASIHSLNYKEAEISVTLFLRSLGKKGLIVIKDPST